MHRTDQTTFPRKQTRCSPLQHGLASTSAAARASRPHRTRLSFHLSGLGQGDNRLPAGGGRSRPCSYDQGQDRSSLCTVRPVREAQGHDGALGQISEQQDGIGSVVFSAPRSDTASSPIGMSLTPRNECTQTPSTPIPTPFFATTPDDSNRHGTAAPANKDTKPPSDL